MKPFHYLFVILNILYVPTDYFLVQVTSMMFLHVRRHQHSCNNFDHFSRIRINVNCLYYFSPRLLELFTCLVTFSEYRFRNSEKRKPLCPFGIRHFAFQILITTVWGYHSTALKLHVPLSPLSDLPNFNFTW